MRSRIMMSTGNISNEEAYKNFINQKKIENLSPKTIQYYNDNWSFFSEFLIRNKIETPKEITKDLINEYVSFLKRKNPQLKDTSIDTYLRAVKVICYYFMERGYLESFPIKKFTARKKPKETYTLDEQIRLLKKPNIKECGFHEFRNWVIICHLFATGNRLRTIINIKIEDIDFSNKIIMLQEVKNSRPYEIPITKEYLPILKEYLQFRGGEPTDYLFCTQYGKQFTDNGLRTVIKRYNQRRGVEKYSIHLFRHLFAKTWILSGGSSKKLQYALGHTTSSTVDEYLNIYGRELEEDFSTYTPLTILKNEIKKDKISMKNKNKYV